MRFKFRLGKYLKPALVVIFILSGLADLYTAITAGMNGWESNPIYMLTQSWILLVALKLMVMYFIIKLCYPKEGFPTERQYYIIVLLLIFGSFVWFLGAWSNIQVGYIDQEYYQSLGEPTAAEKASYYNKTVWIYFLSPLLIAFLPYLVFELSMPYQRYKKRRLNRQRW